MTNTDKENSPGPEDFSTLLKFTSLYISRALDFLGYAFRKKFILIACFTLGGLALGYLKYRISPPVYEVSMQVTQNELSKKVFADKLQNLNDLIKTRSYHSISKKLAISPKLAEDIKSVEAENVFGLPLNKDTSRAGAFFIRLELTANENLDSLQNGVLAFLNDFEYLNQVKKVQRGLYEEKKKFLDSQLSQLDSFKVHYTHFISQSNSAGINLTMSKNDAVELYRESNNMMREKEYITEQLLIHDKILYLLDGFSVPEHPKKSMLSGIMLFMLIGFALGSVIGIFQILKSEINS